MQKFTHTKVRVQTGSTDGSTGSTVVTVVEVVAGVLLIVVNILIVLEVLTEVCSCSCEAVSVVFVHCGINSWNCAVVVLVAVFIQLVTVQ